MNQHPDRARILLVANPQLSSALFQAMILHNIADGSIMARLQDVVDNKPVKAVPPPPTASWASNPSSYYPPPPAAVPPPAAPSSNPVLDASQQVIPS
jgi:cleavage stimulation factor subunit 2